MKRILIILFASILGLASCKKDPKQPETLDTPATITFDGNLNTVSGTYSSYASATPSTKGTGTVSIVITYSGDVKTLSFTTPTGTVINNLGTATVSGGSYTFTKLVKDLRGAADAPLPTSGTSGAVVLTVTATLGNGQTVKRFFTINITG
ncbi:hypothetical protein SRABI27_02040 [Pedobacter sp. Bi27]|uniref:hypothetical protein n=1 Tax=unclassified Pedobacter TaxID=2628915 RepID=UPI001E097C41|nr:MULTISPECIES: hypothetical protein [unclassified Pedobacter]CAH0189606.1 hypothetical protein SRABI36_01717 [Pedobacter sp. Bi36]CAH0213217.1 hypothetical protein SRABI27_02040 [Pedobacter sp. Bi27]CAH0245455.1 hypothetical protein SRABI126_02811 [Pedobacter sp. Bi126]